MYYEPFVGAGGMFFAVAPDHAELSDVNGELINAWQQVLLGRNELLERIRKLPCDSETYYSVRGWEPESDLERAVRFIYLNRTCYGGLYRTNRQGHFNVPYGGGSRTPRPLWEKQLIEKAAIALDQSRVILLEQDFEVALGKARMGDLCYCDPTYVPANRGPFDRYNARPFSWSDQLRLKESVNLARTAGALVLISNIDCPQVRELYQAESCLIVELSREKTIGNAGKRANSAAELLIVYDDCGQYDLWRKTAQDLAVHRLGAARGPTSPVQQQNAVLAVGR